MRHLFLLLLCAVVLTRAAYGQVSTSEPNESANALALAIEEGRAVPPEQAVAAVRSYWNTPDLPTAVLDFEDNGPVGAFGTHYKVRVEFEDSVDYGGLYYVRAIDGVLIGFILPGDTGEEGEGGQLLDMAQALAIAEQFLRERYPPFQERRWALLPERYRDGGSEWRFSWYQILNEHGTHAPFSLDVTVGKYTRRVSTFFAPADRVTGPTVPRITLAQAQQLVLPHAIYDPARVPFTGAYLGLYESPFGIQWLVWCFEQRPAPTPEAPAPVEAPYSVDAVSGGVIVSYPIGGYPPIPASLRPKQRPRHSKLCCPPAEPQAQLRSSQENIPLPLPTRLRHGRLWLRAEGLRGLKARVEAEPGRLEIRDGKRRIAGAAVGAQFRDSGWWVPLRTVAAALRWRVDWQAKGREAIVHH